MFGFGKKKKDNDTPPENNPGDSSGPVGQPAADPNTPLTQPVKSRMADGGLSSMSQPAVQSQDPSMQQPPMSVAPDMPASQPGDMAGTGSVTDQPVSGMGAGAGVPGQDLSAQQPAMGAATPSTGAVPEPTTPSEGMPPGTGLGVNQPQDDLSTQPSPQPMDEISSMAKPVVPPAAEPGTDDNLMGASAGQPDMVQEEPKTEELPASDTEIGAVPTPAPVVPPTQEPAMPSTEPSTSEAIAEEPATPVEPVVPPSPQEQTTQLPADVPQQQPMTGEQAPAPAEPSVPVAEPTQPGVSPTSDPLLAKTHEPVIIMPDDYEMGQTVPVKVKVGMIAHVMEVEHYIQSIELFANDASVGKVDLKPSSGQQPEAEFNVALASGMQLKAVITCNVHGQWESMRTV